MTPKEKAEDLFNKFYDLPVIPSTAKDCALIAVDEMILVLPFTNTNTSLNEYAIHLKKYLQEVKQEIEAL